MATTTTTPNMGLVLPIPGVEPGPTYATDQNTAFTTVDSHNHTAGNGVAVPTAGLFINADLPVNANNLTNVRTVRLSNGVTQPVLATDLSCIYAFGGNLFYNDSSGNLIQITASGAVNVSGAGSISGLGSTTATVVYTAVNSTFTFDSNTATPANLAVGPIAIGQNVSGSKTVTLTPSSSQTTNYTLTFPPAVSTGNQIPLSDSSGNLSWLTIAGGTNVSVSLAGSILTIGTVLTPTFTTITTTGTISVGAGISAGGNISTTGNVSASTLVASLVDTGSISNAGAGVTFNADAVTATAGFVSTGPTPVKLKVVSAGSGTITGGNSITIAHGLGSGVVFLSVTGVCTLTSLVQNRVEAFSTNTFQINSLNVSGFITLTANSSFSYNSVILTLMYA